MEKRKILEQIYDLIKDFEREKWDDESSAISKIKNEIRSFKIKYKYLDKYNVELLSSSINGEENFSLKSEYGEIYVSRIKGKDNCYISNSKEQPKNELLMCYSHGTGSYMFGGTGWGGDSYYDSELFNMYFNELKKYDYKYIDEINNSIYFNLNEGFKLYKKFSIICDKYQKLFNKRMKDDKIEQLKKKLDNLKEVE